MSSDPVIELPVGRSRGFTRASLWGAAAVMLLVPLRAVFERLNFTPTAFSNRFVDYSVALLAFPVVLLAIVCAFRSLRWLLLALWPGRIGVFADENELTLCLGPFRTRCFNTKKMEVRYPFEMAEDEDEGVYEALLPEELQRESMLPHMFDPATGEQVDKLILSFVSGSESDIAARLRPMIERWRS